jgi:hypothetical protein
MRYVLVIAPANLTSSVSYEELHKIVDPSLPYPSINSDISKSAIYLYALSHELRIKYEPLLPSTN